MGITRVLRTASATIERTWYLDEQPIDSSTSVEVTLTDPDGAVVHSGTAASAGAGTGRYTFTVPGQPALTWLTATWSATVGGSAVVAADVVEVVGGFYFTLAEGRAFDASLADATKHTLAELVTTRQEVETECESICGRAFVPRFRRVSLAGTGTPELVLPDGGDELRAGVALRGVRSVRAVKVAPRAGQPYVALSAGELAALAVMPDGTLRRTDGRIWAEGVQNVVLDYEFGADAPPVDLKRAAMRRFRWLLNQPYSGVGDRATSFQAVEGGVYQLDTADATSTGIPDVDAVYDRYSRGGGSGGGDGQGGGPRPASRPLNFDPQYNSLFHGGVR
ncbi:hypothetical protein [Nonomuraea endophytica]|uniref:hypothetical protein n=1 Tax=Nonomuraea endophytica TaxID=714136 RepID=UPI0037C73B85